MISDFHSSLTLGHPSSFKESSGERRLIPINIAPAKFLNSNIHVYLLLGVSPTAGYSSFMSCYTLDIQGPLAL